MKSFKRAIYKHGELEEQATREVSCNEVLRVNGVSGIYEVEVALGTDTGTSGLDYEAFSVPDRFQIFYDGNLVADSKFVGDLNTYKDQLIKEHTLPVYTYHENGFQDSGQTETLTITNSDLANGTATQPKAGKGKLTFNKNKANVKTMTVRVTGIIGKTVWNASPICPYTPTAAPSPSTPTSRHYDLMYQQYSEGNCFDIDNGVIGRYYSRDNLGVGMTLYTDQQLTKKAMAGEYWLGMTIYLITDRGTVTDMFPCHRGLGF